MSANEQDRLKIMVALREGRLKWTQAARLLGLATCQVRRILRIIARGQRDLDVPLAVKMSPGYFWTGTSTRLRCSTLS